jgi:hypothetical protein
MSLGLQFANSIARNYSSYKSISSVPKDEFYLTIAFAMANPLIGYKSHQNSMILGHHQPSFFKSEILVYVVSYLE